MCFTNSFGLVWSGLTHEAVLISSCCFSNISIVLCWSSTYFKYTSIASTVLTDKRHIYVYAVSVFVYLVFRVF
jgi:hypothetical protein